VNPQRRTGKSERLGRFASYAVLGLVSAFALLPVYWALNTSLKLGTHVTTTPPEWFPNPITLENYVSVLSQSSLPRYYLNSVVLVVCTILLVLTIGVHAGYAAARYEFRGKETLLFFLLSTIMIPGVVTLIPQYLLAVQLGLHDTYIALILVFSAWQVPVVVWIMRGFFENIPRELDEAAQVDGCSRLTAFYRVVLPLSWPGLAASAIVVFVWVWNEFLIALTLTASDSTRPLTVGLYFFLGEARIEWERLTAGACAALIPVIVAFLLLQRYFIEGLTAGGTKG
jgi:ABC-type glycerol-3-phosphate transport system permease component